MENQIDPKLLRAVGTTQKLLGEFVCKPVLSDKHLAKPPFRFLHEIFTNVIETTGFLKHAVTPEELKYDTFSGVEEKRAFLRKVIDAIESATGEKCGARPSKILAGKEADKTNGLLQLLAKGIKTTIAKEAKDKDKEGQKKKERDKPKKDVKGHEENKPKSSEPSKSKAKAKQPSKEDIGKNQTRTRPVTKASSTTVTDSKAAKNRQPSNTAITGTDKRPGSSGTKLLATKTASTVSSSTTSTNKKDSQESIKSTSNLKASSSTSLAGKDLAKVNSKQNLLPRKSSSSKLVASPSKESKTNLKAALHSGENIKKEGTTGTVDGSASSAALQSSSKEEIPLQRPVTRTKYRQKDSNEEMVNGNDETQSYNTETEEVESGIENSQNVPAEENTQNNANDLNAQNNARVNSAQSEKCLPINDDNAQVIPAHVPEKSIGNGLSPGRSSSSEEIVTEHMNQKISEWRTSTERTASEETLASRNSKTSEEKLGEIRQSQEDLRKVDESESNENCMKQVKEVKSEESQDHPMRRNNFSPQRSIAEIQFPPAKRPVTVLMDNEDDDEDEAFLVQEKIETDRDLTLERIQQGLSTMNFENLALEHRGLLVNQIMETQRELEQKHPQSRHVILNMQNEMAERDKEAIREVYLKQIETLKEAIQKMAKCATPFANITQRSQDDACLMEIEFRKLRQENERLQRKIDEAKAETSKSLFPLTEELALLDSRIEKMEGAIVLAKQRLHIMDEEYLFDFIEPVCQTTTGDEEYEDESQDILWKFKEGDDDDEDEGGPNKSMLNVFRRALCIHDRVEEEEGRNRDNCPRRNHRIHTKREERPYYRPPSKTPSNVDLRVQGTPYFPVVVNERQSLTNTIAGNQGSVGSFYTQLSGIQTHVQGNGRGSLLQQFPQFMRERPVDKDIKPPWWD